jgi:hypothetical protein
MPAIINNELATGYTHYARITAAEVRAKGSTNQFTIGSLPPGCVVNRCGVFEVVNATGTSTDITLDVGVTGADPDDFIDALDIDGLTKAAFNTGDVLVTTAANHYINNSANAVPVLAEFTGTLTAAGLATGEWIIAWNQIDIGAIA